MKYRKLASKRYSHYKWQKRKESFTLRLIDLILRLVRATIQTLQNAGFLKKQIVEKVSVE